MSCCLALPCLALHPFFSPSLMIPLVDAALQLNTPSRSPQSGPIWEGWEGMAAAWGSQAWGRCPTSCPRSGWQTPSAPQALLAHMKVECKCHGVSGSCEVRTCWRVMPPFRKVGNVLKEKFEGATEVHPQRVGSRKLLVPKSSRFKPYTAHDLVYLLASPDFCDRDPRRGVFGTSGRQCNRTSPAMDGCELLCCGRGFHTTQAEVVERCSCKFRWCCSVKCKQCRHRVEVHSCR